METSRKLALYLSALLLLASSCSSISDPLPAATEGPAERTDISIMGDMQLEDFRKSDEIPAGTDLVAYHYYGTDSRYFDFIIELGSGHTMTIEVYDAQRLNPWQQVNLPYNIYPGQALEDKLYYTNILFSDEYGQCTYSTNFDNNIPPGIFLDVFRIIRNDGEQIQCRVRDMILYKTNDPGRTITINGTFVGVIDFI
jgi:hypothetical protein